MAINKEGPFYDQTHAFYDQTHAFYDEAHAIYAQAHGLRRLPPFHKPFYFIYIQRVNLRLQGPYGWMDGKAGI